MAVSRINEAGLNVNQYGNRNIVINGAMQVAQRGTSSTGLGASSGYFTIDRINPNFSGTSAGRLTMTQETITDLAGFTKCLKLDCTTADTSISAGEYIILTMQAIEGQNLQHIAKGTSSAKKLTLSFYVKGNAAATYVCELRDSNSRKISKSFSVTTDWTRVVMTFDADTDSGGTIVNSNAKGLDVMFWLHAGSTYNSGSAGDLNTSWGSPSNNTRAAGISSFFDSTNRTFFVTGMQLEVGDTATDFEHRSFGDEFARCQRYFFQETGTSTDASGRLGVASGAGTVVYDHTLPVQMRAKPSVALTSTSLRIGDTVAAGFTTTSGTIAISTYSGSASGTYTLGGFSGLTSYRTYLHEPDSSNPGIVKFDAEL